MKKLFFIGAIIALTSCRGSETDIIIVPTADTTLLPDSVVINNYLITDSIANVGDLLDSLAAFEPKAKMTH